MTKNNPLIDGGGKVTLVTRQAGEEGATIWGSSSEGSYILGEGTRDTPGTSATLHLNPADQENGLQDYTTQYTLKEKDYYDKRRICPEVKHSCGIIC